MSPTVPIQNVYLRSSSWAVTPKVVKRNKDVRPVMVWSEMTINRTQPRSAMSRSELKRRGC